MTVSVFSLVTGYSAEYIRSACRKGKIPCSMKEGQYDISPHLVPLWRGKKNIKNKKAGRTIHNSVYLYQCALDEYNQQQGRYYTYGQAVALGVIGDE